MRTPTERVGLSGVSRLTIAGESSVSSESRRAAWARKSVRAKVDHLPGEFAIGRAASLAPAYVVIGRPTSGASPSLTVVRTMLVKT